MKSLAIIIIFLTVIAACKGEVMETKSISLNCLLHVPQSQWDALASKKIYFGHQSVGNNIIDGIKDVLKEHPLIPLTLRATANPEDFQRPVFAHSLIGKNTDPHSKCKAFDALIRSGIGEKVDIALFKFCYVDITGTSDPEKIFNHYSAVLEKLQQDYPTVQFLPVTVPLVSTQKGIKALIKKLLNRKIRGYEDNIKRNQFNKLVRDRFLNIQPIFDLAQIESTNPSATWFSLKNDDNSDQALSPNYTHDGGHLNEQGRKQVAEQLLTLLASLPPPSS